MNKPESEPEEIQAEVGHIVHEVKASEPPPPLPPAEELPDRP